MTNTEKQAINKPISSNTKRIITSKNSPELANRIKQASAYFLKKNDQLYRDLANK